MEFDEAWSGFISRYFSMHNLKNWGRKVHLKYDLIKILDPLGTCHSILDTQAAIFILFLAVASWLFETLFQFTIQHFEDFNAYIFLEEYGTDISEPGQLTVDSWPTLPTACISLVKVTTSVLVATLTLEGKLSQFKLYPL